MNLKSLHNCLRTACAHWCALTSSSLGKTSAPQIALARTASSKLTIRLFFREHWQIALTAHWLSPKSFGRLPQTRHIQYVGLLAIDPGTATGWARFNDTGRLEACGLNDRALDASVTRVIPALGVTRAVIERPHSAKTLAPVKDIITLAIRAGEWGGTIRSSLGVEPEYIEPASWKGSLDKNKCQARVWARLTPDERALTDKAGSGIAPSKRHNMMDAIGIGLVAVGRGPL